MRTFKDLAEGFLILSKYSDGGICTGHDELFIHVEPSSVSTKDLVRLEELRFFVDEYNTCFKILT